MNRSRITGDLVSQNNIFVDIANDRVGIGSTIPGEKLSLPDDAKISLGDSTDFKIYHNTVANTTSPPNYLYPNSNYIDSVASQNLFIRTSTAGIYLGRTDGAHAASFHTNTAGVVLYYDASGSGGERFRTKDYGINITGTTDTDGLVVSGVVTATSYSGDGSNLTNTGSTLSEPSSGTQRIVTTSLTTGTMTSSGTGSELAFDYSNNHLEFSDNTKATFGTGNDLEIYHTGTGSVINDAGTGTLHLRTAGSNRINVEANGVKLFYQGNEKLETTSNGVNITGRLLATGSSGRGLIFNDSVKISLGSNNDLEIYHDGSHSYIDDVGTGNLKVRSNNFRVSNADESKLSATFVPSGAVELYHNNSKKLETTSGGVDVTGTVTADNQLILNSGDNVPARLDLYCEVSNAHYTRLQAPAHSTFSGNVTVTLPNTHGNLAVLANAANNRVVTATATHAMTGESGLTYDGSTLAVTGNITVSGTVDGVDIAAFKTSFDNLSTDIVNDTSPQLGGNLDVNTKNILFGDSASASDDRLIFGAGSDLSIYHDGSHSIIEDTGTGNLFLRSDSVVSIRGTTIALKNAANTETLLHCVENGAVELYHDNTKRLETTSSGVEIPHALFVGQKIDMPDHTTGSTGMILLGTGDDLFMYHDGTNSHLRNNTGTFNIRATNFRLTDAAIQHVYLKTNDGGNDEVGLYYDNSVRLITTSSGVTVSGTITTNNGGGNAVLGSHLDLGDNQKVRFGASDDLVIYHSGSSSFISDEGTGSLKITTNGTGVDIQKGTSETIARFIADGAVELYHNNIKTLETLNEGIKIHTGSSSTVIRISSNTDVESIIQGYNSDLFIKSPSGGGITLFANGTEDAVKCIANGAVELYHNGNRQVFTFDGGLNWQDNKKAEFGNSGDLKIYHDGSHTRMHHSGTGQFIIYGNDNDQVKLMKGSSEEGVILNNNGNVELYHNNTKRFETTANGNRTNGELLYLGPNNVTNYVHSGGNLSMTADSNMYFVADCNDTSGVAPSGEFIWGGGSNTNTDSNQDFTNAEFGNGGQPRNQYMILDENSLRPANNNNLDFGTSSLRWKTIFTMDLELSNKGSSNSVDGTWGDWTLQEGENDIYMINNRTGKKFKIKMEAVD